MEHIIFIPTSFFNEVGKDYVILKYTFWYYKSIPFGIITDKLLLCKRGEYHLIIKIESFLDFINIVKLFPCEQLNIVFNRI